MPRLTPCLQKLSHRWAMRNEWKKKGVFWEPRLIVPHHYVEQGVEIIDPVEKYMSKPEVEPWTPPVPDDPRFAPEPTIRSDPNYHEEHIYGYTKNTRLFESERQALLLTKSQKIDGLPANVENLIGSVSVPNQDELVQRYIMQAHKWDPTQDNLPKRFNRQLPGWKFKSEKGIPKKKAISNLLSNLLRLCHITSCGAHPELLSSYRHIQDHYYKAQYKHQGQQIEIHNTCDWLTTSSRPLAPLADESQVIDSVSHKLPDLFPVAPTIDLRKIHIYTDENITGFQPSFSHACPHTMLLSNTDYWYSQECSARAILLMFGQALAVAHQKYGPGVGELPEPISLQCVHSDGVTFHFTALQLNTLDMTSSEGVKNLVWVDGDNKMFEKILPKRAMLRNTLYQDYDPLVFQKLLAMYVNGAV